MKRLDPQVCFVCGVKLPWDGPAKAVYISWMNARCCDNENCYGLVHWCSTDRSRSKRGRKITSKKGVMDRMKLAQEVFPK